MPFDGATPKRTSEQQANLLLLLDGLQELPDEFYWDFCGYAGCAVGLYCRLTRKALSEVCNAPTGFHWMAGELGISVDESVHAFGIGRHDKPPSEVTPHDVADILEGYL